MSDFNDDYNEQELKDAYAYIAKLEQANKSMLTLIHLNDQKAALMELDPEFAEAMTRLDQTSPPPQ